MYDFHYGIGSAYGYISYDTLCIKKGKYCSTNDFAFFSMAQLQDLSNLHSSGIVGLSPGHHQSDRNDLFILKMKKSGAIKHAVFSFYISGSTSRKNIMTLGGFNLKKFGRHGFPVNYHQVKAGYDQWWLSKMDSVTF